jgi:hypothetical protein
MKKLVITAALAVAAVGLFADAASANHPGPYCATGQCNSGHRWGTFFGKHPMPAFQAAPWYLYWPYNAHFQTPAPLAGPYYAPPYAGGQLVNPYFPSHPGLMPGAVPVPAAPGHHPVPHQ